MPPHFVKGPGVVWQVNSGGTGDKFPRKVLITESLCARVPIPHRLVLRAAGAGPEPSAFFTRWKSEVRFLPCPLSNSPGR